MDDLNHITLTGVLERAPFTQVGEQGQPWLSFMLKLTETRPSGQAFALYVPIECYGQAAEQARDLRPDDAILVAGKLKWSSYTTKTGEKKSGLAVLARLVKVLQPAEVPA